MAPFTNKKINFNATYNNQKLIIECKPDEVADEIASRYNININDVTIYTLENNERVEVSPNKITDFMRIEIVPKRNGQKTIHARMELEAKESNKKVIDGMISKLRQNTPLTGQERKVLIEALETHSTAIFKKRKLDQTDIPQKTCSNKKIQVAVPAGVKESFTQTDPVELPLNDIEDPLVKEKDARKKLKQFWYHGNTETEEIDILMKETFDDRRNFIFLKSPPVLAIKEQYPALFCSEQVKKELDRIFYPGKCREFLRDMEKYTEILLHYDQTNIMDILEVIDKARSKARTPKQESYAQVVGSIFVLAKLLNEGFGFIRLNDHPHSSKDVYPYIDASMYSLQRIFSDEIIFHIMVEGQHLCEASDFCDAILCLMGCFFIFNIDYPESCRRTLTVIEKVHLKANDTMEMDGDTEQMIKLLIMKGNSLKQKKNRQSRS